MMSDDPQNFEEKRCLCLVEILPVFPAVHVLFEPV